MSRSSLEKMAAPEASAAGAVPSTPEVTVFSLPSARTSLSLSAFSTMMAGASRQVMLALLSVRVTFIASSPVLMTICPLSSVPLTEYSPAAEMVTTLPFTATPPPVKVAPSPVSSIYVAVSSGAAAPLPLPQPQSSAAQNIVTSRSARYNLLFFIAC